jgi:hypothetical protein
MKIPISFVTGIDGAVAELHIKLEPAVKPLTFTRVPVETEEPKEADKIEA